MSKPYQLVVFDWEGTLADTLGQILKIMAAEAATLGLGEVDETIARQTLQFGLIVTIKKVFPGITPERQAHLLEAIQKALASRSKEACLFTGARELLTRINNAGMDLALATNKGQHSLQRTLKGVGVESFFEVTRSAGQCPAKPCPQMLEEIMTHCAVVPSATVMIGDSLSDIEMAAHAGVAAVGMDFYNQQEQSHEMQAAGAIEVFNNYEQLAAFLQV